MSKDVFAAAGSNDHVRLRRMMKDNVLDTKMKDGTGWTPLHHAAYWNSLEAMDLLFMNNADPNSQEQLGKTPMQLAIENKSIEAITKLLSHGASPNIVDVYDRSVLHRAALSGHREAVVLLLAAGADMHQLDQDGKNPPKIAFEEGHDDIVALFAEVEIGGIKKLKKSKRMSKKEKKIFKEGASLADVPKAPMTPDQQKKNNKPQRTPSKKKLSEPVPQGSPDQRSIQRAKNGDKSEPGSPSADRIASQDPDLSTFLKMLGMEGMYSEINKEQGFEHPSDYLLYKPEELQTFGFKPVHARKIVQAASKIRAKRISRRASKIALPKTEYPEEVTKLEYFQGDLLRGPAEELLKTIARPFVVRGSDTRVGSYTLSMRLQDGSVKHFRVDVVDDEYFIKPTERFPSLDALVHNYCLRPLKVNNKSSSGSALSPKKGLTRHITKT